MHADCAKDAQLVTPGVKKLSRTYPPNLAPAGPGPYSLEGRFKRLIKPYTFSIVLQMIRIIRATCPLVPCNPPASRCEALRAGGRRVCEICGLKKIIFLIYSSFSTILLTISPRIVKRSAFDSCS